MRLVPVFRAGRIESKIYTDCSGRTGKKHRGYICLVYNLTDYKKLDAMDFEPIYEGKTKIGTVMTKRCTWECDPWYEVGESYFVSSYIHAGLSGIEETFKGPAAAFRISEHFSQDSINANTL